MDLIYLLLKNIRYLLKNKKLITIIMIILLFFTLCNHIFAVEDNISLLFYDEQSSENVKNFIFNRINTDLNVDLTSQRYFVFDDVYSKRYIIVSQSNPNVWANYMVSDYDFSLRCSSGRAYFTVYSVSYDDLSSSKITDFSIGPNDGTFSLTQILTFPICTRSSFLFSSSGISLGIDIKTQYTVPTCDTYEEMEKQQAVILYANNNYDSTSNTLTPFTIKLYNEETVDLFSILLSSSSDYWDSEKHCFIIPFSYFDVYCQNNVKYGMYLTLYSDESFIYSEEMFSFDFINNSIIFEGGQPTPPDTPTTPDYSEKFNELNSSINDLNTSQQETNQFLKDDSINDSDFELPTVEVDDPSSNFFDTIFMGVYNAVTVQDDVTISFDVINTHIDISSANFNFLTDNRFSLLRNLLSMSWIFGIGIFILKDIRKILDKIKSGNVDTAVTDDVKADMV